MNNKIPKVTYIYNRYKKATLTKEAVVEMRITYNSKQKYISTGIFLNLRQWKNGKVISRPDSLLLNQHLDKLLVEVREILFDMMKSDFVDLSSIPQRLSINKTKHTTFISFCEQRAIIRKYGKTKDSQERYNRFLRLFCSWGKIINFTDITDTNIIDYDKFLLSKGMKTYSKWQNYHRFLNSFILDAICAGYLHRNPYAWVNIDKGKTVSSIDKCLTLDQFKKVRNAIMPTESLKKVRDVFVFQTYTCLRYSDLLLFDLKYIREIKGMNVYIRDSVKTRKPFIVPILPPAWSILMKYNGELPIISNVKYNLYLKNVAQAAGLDLPLSSHWARHTGATLMLNEGLDTRIIRKICGHSSTNITEQVYAKVLDETVVDAVREIIPNLE